MDFLFDIIGGFGLVIGIVIGAGIGWGVSMLVWGEPNIELISTLALTLGVIGALSQALMDRPKK